MGYLKKLVKKLYVYLFKLPGYIYIYLTSCIVSSRDWQQSLDFCICLLQVKHESSSNNSEEPREFGDLNDLEALLDEDIFMPTATQKLAFIVHCMTLNFTAELGDQLSHFDCYSKLAILILILLLLRGDLLTCHTRIKKKMHNH